MLLASYVPSFFRSVSVTFAFEPLATMAPPLNAVLFASVLLVMSLASCAITYLSQSRAGTVAGEGI